MTTVLLSWRLQHLASSVPGRSQDCRTACQRVRTAKVMLRRLMISPDASTMASEKKKLLQLAARFRGADEAKRQRSVRPDGSKLYSLDT